MRALLLSAFFALPSGAIAGSLPPCQADQASETECLITVAQLHPTQLTVGMIEVNERSEKIRTMSERKYEAYLASHEVPIVIGPGGTFYLTDHHHFALAVANVNGMDAELPANVIANWREKSQVAFWQAMTQADYLYLYDETGAGPKAVKDLPATVRGLHDDPYRSLAWAVRKAGGYGESATNHADFAWADFFRSRVPLDAINHDFQAAVDRGVTLARSPAAEGLPGYQDDSSAHER